MTEAPDKGAPVQLRSETEKAICVRAHFNHRADYGNPLHDTWLAKRRGAVFTPAEPDDPLWTLPSGGVASGSGYLTFTDGRNPHVVMGMIIEPEE